MTANTMNTPRDVSAEYIWQKFEQSEYEGDYFEYECAHPTEGECVRSTVLGYCPIMTREEVDHAKEKFGGNFYRIVRKGTGKPFSNKYHFYQLNAGKEIYYFAERIHFSRPS